MLKLVDLEEKNLFTELSSEEMEFVNGGKPQDALGDATGVFLTGVAIGTVGGGIVGNVPGAVAGAGLGAIAGFVAGVGVAIYDVTH